MEILQAKVIMKNISVTVHFTGLVDVRNVTSGSSVPIPEGTSLSELLSILGIIEQHKRYIISMINGKKETLFYVLKNNDVVELFLPVGGG